MGGISYPQSTKMSSSITTLLLFLAQVTFAAQNTFPTFNPLCEGTSASVDSLDPPWVQIISGSLQGKRVLSGTGKPVNAFLGIPFAESPLHELRFRRPVPYRSSFNGTYDATKLPNACPQEPINFFENFAGKQAWNTNTQISEDCLYLNVWVPATKMQTQRNVLLWIYGGGFFSGSISLDLYNGATLAAESNTIVVSCQYRLGPLGFLYLGTDDAPGNQGLLDQQLAMEWANANIAFFGGDPDQVTLFGESAGAASVSFHLLSLTSQRLFNRAVLMSGAALSSWAFNSPDEAHKHTVAIAKQVNCHSLDSSVMLECLRSVNHSVLTQSQFKIHLAPMAFPMGPTIDPYFLTDSPYNLIQNKNLQKKDVLIGNTLDEGSYLLPYFFPKLFSTWNSSTLSHSDMATILSKLFPTMEDAPEKIYNEYHPNAEQCFESALSNNQLVIDALGDAYLTCGCQEFAKKWSQAGAHVYYYMFSHLTVSDPRKWMGVKHGDEIGYFFGQPFSTPEAFTAVERLISEKVISLLSNFANTGVPSTEWNNCQVDDGANGNLRPVYIPEAGGYREQHRNHHCTFWNQKYFYM